MDELTIKYLSWVALAFSMVGAVLINKKNIFGFGCWICANTAWIVVAVGKEIPAQVVLWCVFLALNFHGIYNWRRDNG